MGALRLALIIPTYGRPEDLASCLRSIDEGAGSELVQVIVIDDAPWLPAVVPPRIAGAEVRVVRNSEPTGAAASRNKGLTMLRPEIDAVGFLDDDVRLTPKWFATLRAELKPGCGGVTGPIRRFDRGVVARARQLRYDARYRPLHPNQPVDFLAGGNTVIWRASLERAGGFPVTPTMSDTLLARRLGEIDTPCRFVPELAVLHRNSKGMMQACVAAWQAGAVEGRRRKTTYARRLATDLRGIATGSDPPAAALNAVLDAVFLTAHATSRVSWPSRRLPPVLESPSTELGSVSRAREQA